MTRSASEPRHAPCSPARLATRSLRSEAAVAPRGILDPIDEDTLKPVRLDRVVVDRGSVFAANLFPAATEADVKAALAALVKDKHYRFASHNVVAYRLRGPDGQIVEHKDDGYSGRGRESGAGRVVLEVLRAKGLVGAVVVVTRWFGGIPLGGSRFRHFGAAAGQAIDAARGP